jgi:hypothetical protein
MMKMDSEILETVTIIEPYIQPEVDISLKYTCMNEWSREVTRNKFLTMQNTRDLLDIQKIILLEEGREFNLDETLARVLSFYGQFVPFRRNKYIE